MFPLSPCHVSESKLVFRWKSNFIRKTAALSLEMGTERLPKSNGARRDGIKKSPGQVCKKVPGGCVGSTTAPPDPTVRWPGCYYTN